MQKIGLILTGLWVIMVVIIVFLNFKSAISLQLNEWGDFLAGITAPVAFLWLIVGYRLQSEELKMNTKALVQQAEELEKQNNFLEIQANAAEELTRTTKDTARREHRNDILDRFSKKL